MKKALITLLAIVGMASAASADEYVHSYIRRDGTFVPDHHRSTADGNFYNNWSTSGNTNPYTGERGYRTAPSAPTLVYPSFGRSRW